MLHVLTRMEVFSASVLMDSLEMELTVQVIIIILFYNSECIKLTNGELVDIKLYRSVSCMLTNVKCLQ